MQTNDLDTGFPTQYRCFMDQVETLLWKGFEMKCKLPGIILYGVFLLILQGRLVLRREDANGMYFKIAL